MKEKAMEKLPRLILTILLSAGLIWTVLGALGLEISTASWLAVCTGEAILLEAVSFSRRSALWGSLGLVGLGAVWTLNHAQMLSDVLRALTLEISGVAGALPLVSRETGMLLTMVFTLLCFFCTRPGTGSVGALLLAAGACVLLWMTDRADLISRMIPAGIAAMALLLTENHREVSLIRVLPWAAAIVLLTFGLTPAQGFLSPELKEKTDSLRQNVMDRLFFTEPRDVFSLSTEGFYPQGTSQLGGPVTLSDHPVMQVSTPRNAYLRGVMMNAYDGRTWRNTLGGRRFLWEAGGMAAQRSILFDMALPSEGLSSALTEPEAVFVRMLGSGASTLFAPQRIRTLRTGGELVAYFTNSSELFATRNLQEGDTWSVTAPLFQAGDPGLGTLVDAAESGEDPQWENLLETYTALPSHLEEPVWQLARDITENLSSPYEKAFAIQNYLSRNYRYTLDAAWQPANLDFVTNFLFNTREGYCTYFASAMTVLCRMAGLPARYVEGYLAEPNANGEALVTGENAHAWTEVYFRGFGWLTFDATPRRAGSETEDSPERQSETPNPELDATPTPTTPPDTETETPAPSEHPEDSETPLPDEKDSPNPEMVDPVEKGRPADSTPFPWALLLLLLPLGVWLRWMWTSPGRREKRLTEETDRFDLWLKEAMNRLSAMGYTRGAGETIMNFTRRLSEQEGMPVGQLGECASLLHYGRVQALATDTKLARNAANELKMIMPMKARLRYARRRMFRKRLLLE